jgi:SAM-dependent methyltransferase
MNSQKRKFSTLIKSSLASAPLKEKLDKLYFYECNPKEQTTDSFDRIKLFFKKYPNFYYFLIKYISPVYSNQRSLSNFLETVDGIVLNIGSGNSPRQTGILNVDILDYDNVDIICDIHSLPFKDKSIDAVLNIAVLEHVKSPQLVLNEIYRVLKPGGKVFSVVPFMQPFHASPNDFQRYTLPGIEFLHIDFEKVDSGVYSGPVSGALWVMQEFIASTLSLGSNNLRNLLSIFLMFLLWPLKFFDIILNYLGTSNNLASSFYFHGFKSPINRLSDQ